MQQSPIKYIQNNLAWIIIGVALRSMHISAHLSRYSYYDMEEAIEYFSGNHLADKPSIATWIGYKILSVLFSKPKILTAVYTITMISDLICGYLLNNIMYFLICSVLPTDVMSVVCLLFTLHHKKIYLQWITPLLLLMCMESTHYKCEPGINAYWYINMQMFDEYKVLFHDIFRITHYFFLLLSVLSNLTSTKLYMAMVFKDFGYRGYLLVWCVLESQRIKNSKILNLCRGIAIICSVIDVIVWSMLIFGGVGNMNFLCWSHLVNILATGAGTIIHEHAARKLNKKHHKNRYH